MTTVPTQGRTNPTHAPSVRLYEGDAENLILSEASPDRVSLLPGIGGRVKSGEGPGVERLRIMWGQDLLRDLLDGRYRTVICGVNTQDNSHGIIAQMVELIQTSQWSAGTVTNYARLFEQSVTVATGSGASLAARADREPFVLKFDLDSLLILALLRPKGRDFFTLEDLSRGFGTITKMLRNRRERLPVATVSFLNARANRLAGSGGGEPSFEAVLRTMYQAGFRGDVYTAPEMWKFGHVGVFPTYPFPEGVERMRAGSS